MKVERFITEYANYKKKRIAECLVGEKFKEEAYEIIDNAVNARKRGLITVDETIKLIL